MHHAGQLGEVFAPGPAFGQVQGETEGGAGQAGGHVDQVVWPVKPDLEPPTHHSPPRQEAGPSPSAPVRDTDRQGPEATSHRPRATSPHRHSRVRTGPAEVTRWGRLPFPPPITVSCCCPFPLRMAQRGSRNRRLTGSHASRRKRPARAVLLVTVVGFSVGWGRGVSRPVVGQAPWQSPYGRSEPHQQGADRCGGQGTARPRAARVVAYWGKRSVSSGVVASEAAKAS
jgi:hypothetical protein